MLKIRCPTCIIGKFCIIHYLEKYVKNIRVCLFNFIQKEHAKGVLSYGLCQKTSLVKAHIAWGCSDKPGHCMFFHVFTHVKALKMDTQNLCSLPCKLCLSDTCRAGKKEGANGLFRVCKACTRPLNGLDHGPNGLILPENH